MKFGICININIFRACREPEDRGCCSCSTCTREEKSSRHASDRQNAGDLFRWGKLLIWDIYKV